MEIAVNSIYNAFYAENNNISIKEKVFAICLRLIPIIVVAIYCFNA